MKKIITLLAFLILCTSSAFATDELIDLSIETSGNAFLTPYSERVSFFSEENNDIYNTILNGLNNTEQTIEISKTISVTSQEDATNKLNSFQQEVIDTFTQIVNENQRIYYARGGYNIKSNGSGYYNAFELTATLTPTYTGTYDKQAISTFNAKVDGLKAFISQNADTDIEKALILHDYLVTNIAYNQAVADGNYSGDASDIHTAYGALVLGDAVCEGYARAYKLILNELNIKCETVSSESINHMWNAVSFDNGLTWFYVDATWDDPVKDVKGRCLHKYFLLSFETISTDHVETQLDWTFKENSENDSIYETGYAWNNSNHAFYKLSDKYYFINSKKLYKTSNINLLSNATELATFDNLSTYSGVVWFDDMIFYITNQNSIIQYNINNTDSGVIGQFSSSEWVGISYENGNIIASNSSQGQLISVQPVNYPFSWNDNLTTTAIVGTQKLYDNTLQIGFVNVDEIINKNLFIALYSGNKMIDIADITPQDMKNGLNILEYNITKEYDEAKIFVLDNNKPVIPCYENIA